jgi:hypothetical protein
MLLGPFNGLQNWHMPKLAPKKSMPKLGKFFKGYLTHLKRFFAPKMLKSVPKWLKLMPEILKMPIFVTQFNFKVSKFRLTSTNCKQIKLKSKKTCAQNRYKNTGCKGFCAMERPDNRYCNLGCLDSRGCHYLTEVAS